MNPSHIHEAYINGCAVVLRCSCESSEELPRLLNDYAVHSFDTAAKPKWFQFALGDDIYAQVQLHTDSEYYHDVTIDAGGGYNFFLQIPDCCDCTYTLFFPSLAETFAFWLQLNGADPENLVESFLAAQRGGLGVEVQDSSRLVIESAGQREFLDFSSEAEPKYIKPAPIVPVT